MIRPQFSKRGESDPQVRARWQQVRRWLEVSCTSGFSVFRQRDFQGRSHEALWSRLPSQDRLWTTTRCLLARNEHPIEICAVGGRRRGQLCEKDDGGGGGRRSLGCPRAELFAPPPSSTAYSVLSSIIRHATRWLPFLRSKSPSDALEWMRRTANFCHVRLARIMGPNRALLVIDLSDFWLKSAIQPYCAGSLVL